MARPLTRQPVPLLGFLLALLPLLARAADVPLRSFASISSGGPNLTETPNYAVAPSTDFWSNATAPLPTSSWWIALAMDNRSALVRADAQAARVRPLAATAVFAPPGGTSALLGRPGCRGGVAGTGPPRGPRAQPAPRQPQDTATHAGRTPEGRLPGPAPARPRAARLTAAPVRPLRRLPLQVAAYPYLLRARPGCLGISPPLLINQPSFAVSTFDEDLCAGTAEVRRPRRRHLQRCRTAAPRPGPPAAPCCLAAALHPPRPAPSPAPDQPAAPRRRRPRGACSAGTRCP
jgi:hypothetical protein